ncbi:hypothetical protein QAD02_004268 [Eretmocerus hayati]|uniref:Uncharacterized protein n=1 Tax=Eretmocerus hayati TaxID=131215 RepID=A0ACC2NPI0_9HYME|nr:hypothetical protein QAD02_004268 [Eretmocerus hayati]
MDHSGQSGKSQGHQSTIVLPDASNHDQNREQMNKLLQKNQYHILSGCIVDRSVQYGRVENVQDMEVLQPVQQSPRLEDMINEIMREEQSAPQGLQPAGNFMARVMELPDFLPPREVDEFFDNIDDR